MLALKSLSATTKERQMKKRNKQKSKRRLRRIGEIILVIILILLSYMAGFKTGVDNIPEPVTNPPENGRYNVDIYEGGKVVVTTRLQYIYSKSNKLIIYGKPTHEPIE